jgi:RimJ/RimL family protein N-acetyltransferase
MIGVGDLPVWRKLTFEAGRDNGERFFFAPMSGAQMVEPTDERIADFTTRMNRPVTQRGWLRLWMVMEDDQAVGEASLRGGELASDLHRCTLGIGLLPGARGRGLGRALLDAILRWGENEPTLHHLDLFVFDGNAPALALYRRLGFVELGRVPDRFRIEGRSITDIHMVRALK